MISLFFGEFYRLSRVRRLLLVPIALILSLSFNIFRMTILTMIAARKSPSAIAQYHDPTGVTIAIVCTLVMWVIAVLLRRPDAKVANAAAAQGGQPPASRSLPTEARPSKLSLSALSRVAIGLLVWLLVVEVGVQAWYFSMEAGFKPGPDWTVVFPKDNPTLKEIIINETTQYLLRYDAGKEATWDNPDGTHWQVFYCMWLPGRVAGYLAKRHTPDICIAAVGLELRKDPELMVVKVKGLELPVRHYIFGSPGHSLQVFHCRWEAGIRPNAYTAYESARFNLVRGIWAGRGNHGQKVVEVIISGIEDPELAKQEFLSEIDKLIEIEKSR
jgi:exosortase/archaeosortase family protein